MIIRYGESLWPGTSPGQIELWRDHARLTRRVGGWVVSGHGPGLEYSERVWLVFISLYCHYHNPQGIIYIMQMSMHSVILFLVYCH